MSRDNEIVSFNSEYNNKSVKSFLLQTSHKIIDTYFADNVIYKNATEEERTQIVPLLLLVFETKDISGYRCFKFCFSGYELSKDHLPTFVKKRKGINIAFYLLNTEPMSIHKVPSSLFKTVEEPILWEDSWFALYCQETLNHVVIHKGLIPVLSAIKQIHNFDCKQKRKKQKVIIEEPILDYEILNAFKIRIAD